MEVRKAYLYFKILIVFISTLAVEYLLSGVYYRLIRESDFLTADVISTLCSIGVFYWLFRKLLQNAWKERILFKTLMACFLAFCFLGACFFRFSIQLANGFLDGSSPETQIIVVTGKEISAFGGSFKEGFCPPAHLIYFQDWHNPGDSCELLAPTFYYYLLVPGSRAKLIFHRGFFHFPWIEGFQLLKSS